ncbi:MAG: hypothetical protein MZU97_02665 [Bacillus subtilis]|nr:hypothetical protein [Bacillus subtilis]
MNRNNYILLTLIFLCVCVISGFKLQDKLDNKPVSFYSPEKGVYIVTIDTKNCPECVQPYVSDNLETVENIAKKTRAIAAINAGFFDPSNAKTTSYVIKDSTLIADPALNDRLMLNEKLKELLPSILNRSEFRILRCKDTNNFKIDFSITPHDSISENCGIIHSIQAGPMLLPELRLEQESFVNKRKRQS